MPPPLNRPASPSPDEIREWRRAAGLSAREAGALVCTTGRVWQQWEAGDRRMHPAFWELARIKTTPSYGTNAPPPGVA